MKVIIAVLALAAALSACAQGPHLDYRSLSSTETPATWDPTSKWVFIAVDEHGDILQTMTLRFTDKPAESCISGDWKQVEVLDSRGKLNRDSGSATDKFPFGGDAKPGYLLEGRLLTVGLTTNICDDYYEFVGELTETGFFGQFISTGLYFFQNLGKVYGAEAATD